MIELLNNCLNWQGYVMGDIDVEIWLRIADDGEYLEEAYLDKREIREYLSYYGDD